MCPLLPQTPSLPASDVQTALARSTHALHTRELTFYHPDPLRFNQLQASVSLSAKREQNGNAARHGRGGLEEPV